MHFPLGTYRRICQRGGGCCKESHARFISNCPAEPTTSCQPAFDCKPIEESARNAAAMVEERHIQLAAKYLQVGINTISLNMFNKYRKDGVGLHTFTDKSDDSQYLYTQFEADFAHYVLPCFDQPDLKAPWTFKAVVSDDWIVVANDRENEEMQNNPEVKQGVMNDL